MLQHQYSHPTVFSTTEKPRISFFLSWNIDDADFPAVLAFSSCLARAGVSQPNCGRGRCAPRALAAWPQVMASASPGKTPCPWERRQDCAACLGRGSSHFPHVVELGLAAPPVFWGFHSPDSLGLGKTHQNTCALAEGCGGLNRGFVLGGLSGRCPRLYKLSADSGESPGGDPQHPGPVTLPPN